MARSYFGRETREIRRESPVIASSREVTCRVMRLSPWRPAGLCQNCLLAQPSWDFQREVFPVVLPTERIWNMSRWHKLSCEAPEVVVEKQAPRCRAYGSQCSWEDILSQRKSTNSQPILPPPTNLRDSSILDGPLLFRTAPDLGREPPISCPAKEPLTGDGMDGSAGLPLPVAARPPEAQQPIDPVHSLVYGKRLGSDQFRLACPLGRGRRELPRSCVLGGTQLGPLPGV